MTKEFDELKAKADAGDAEAQVEVGHRYRCGSGVKKEPALAFKYYKMAAKQNNGAGLAGKGICHENGIGTKKDTAEALKCYQEAEKMNDPLALNQLGQFYQNGIEVNKDPNRAFDYFTRAVEEEAKKPEYLAAKGAYLNNLGYCYAEGIGTDIKGELAIKYYKMAVAKGSPEALNNLGWCYENGIGVVAPDLDTALKYYKAAAGKGNTFAQGNLERLKKAS